MTLRKGHGNGAGVPRVEVLPVDELPLGVHAPAQVERTEERNPDGTWRPGARTAQSAGGRAHAGETRLARELGLDALPDDAAFAPYKTAAGDFRRAQCTMLARTVGGGICGPAPSSIITTAAWQLAASQFLHDAAARTCDPKLFMAAARLGDASRQNLLAAHELCAKEAKSRLGQGDADADLAAIARAAEEETEQRRAAERRALPTTADEDDAA